MTSRRFTVPTFAALTLAALLLPAAANAQGTIWDRIRERARQEQENERRRDDHGHRDDDIYDRGRRRDRDNDHRAGRISEHERRTLREAARRISSRSRELQRDIDRLLDQSRHDGTRHEDHINTDVRRFRQAADRFRDRAGDSNNLNNSAGEARQLLETAEHVGSNLRRLRRIDGRTQSTWSQLRHDLRIVSDIYGFRFRDFDDYRRGRNDDHRNRYPY